jgi:hypothetical protein
MAQRLPQRVADVRGDRVQQQHDGLERLVAHRAHPVAHVVELAEWFSSSITAAMAVLKLWRRP